MNVLTRPEVIVGILSLLGTLIGSITGIMTANKLTIYRIEQLEKKVDKHNNLVERMAVVESEIETLKSEVK
jgi:hypothetical protein